MDSYDPDALPVGPSFLKKPDSASLLSRLKADYFTQYLEGGDHTADPYMRNYAAVEEDVGTEEGWRRLRAHYFANINLVDRMVGKITSAIDDAGVADDTVVLFTSDHGDMLGDHGMLEKRSMYEESSRVPMLMRVPWLAREQTMVPGQHEPHRPGADGAGPAGRPRSLSSSGQEPGPRALRRGVPGGQRCLHRVERRPFEHARPASRLGGDRPDEQAAMAPRWCPAGGSSTCAPATSASCST